MPAVFSETLASSSVLSGWNHQGALNLIEPRSAPSTEVVYVVHEDPCVWESVSRILSANRIRVACFFSLAEFLSHTRAGATTCMILDLDLPGIRLLQLEGLPFVIVSRHCDVSSAVQAMKAGAIEVFTNPVDADMLLASVRTAFAQERRQRRRKEELSDLFARHSKLTPREREVFSLIAGGLLNKQAAAQLGISDITVQIHRGQVMRKMQADSFAELVRMAVKLRIPCWREARKPAEQGSFA